MASKTTNYGLHKFDLTDSPPDITAINDSMDKIDAELKKRLENTKAIPIENGGTGANTKKEAFANLAYLGNNPISSPSEDTTQKWCELGTGYAWYTTDGLLINQPYQYMFVINYIQDKDVFQIGYEQKVGTIYYRGGNYSGWIMNWTPLLSTNGGKMSGTISMDGNGIVFSKDADWNNGNYFAMFESQNTLGMQVRHNGKNRFFNFNDNTHTIDKAFQMWWYDDGKEHSSRFFGEHNTSLLATTIQNLLKGGSISVIKSVQRGTVNLEGTASANESPYTMMHDVTINSINTNKAMLLINGHNYTSGNAGAMNAYGRIKNANTLTFNNTYAHSSQWECKIDWQVIEFY